MAACEKKGEQSKVFETNAMQTGALTKSSFPSPQSAKIQTWPGILTPSAGEVRVLGS